MCILLLRLVAFVYQNFVLSGHLTNDSELDSNDVLSFGDICCKEHEERNDDDDDADDEIADLFIDTSGLITGLLVTLAVGVISCILRADST